MTDVSRWKSQWTGEYGFCLVSDIESPKRYGSTCNITFNDISLLISDEACVSWDADGVAALITDSTACITLYHNKGTLRGSAHGVKHSSYIDYKDAWFLYLERLGSDSNYSDGLGDAMFDCSAGRWIIGGRQDW